MLIILGVTEIILCVVVFQFVICLIIGYLCYLMLPISKYPVLDVCPAMTEMRYGLLIFA
jgi:hypothetical protein